MRTFNKQSALKLGMVLALVVLAGAITITFYPFAPKPCSKPIEYSIGSFSSEFNITQAEFLADINAAEKIWEQPISRQLFEYLPAAGPLKINLVYDSRQQATDRLKSLGFTIENTQASYNSLKSRYDSLTQTYSQSKAAIDAEVASFESRKKAYEDQVTYWNNQGGAPKQTANQLNAEYKSLMALAGQINTDKNTMNTLVNDLNALVTVLNSLGSQLNLNVTTYNTVGQSRGEEFEEGVYVSNVTGKAINIYEFVNQDQLIRLLAHEMGHALGLEHVNDPQAIMYRLNQAKNEILTADDLAELKQVCGIK